MTRQRILGGCCAIAAALACPAPSAAQDDPPQVDPGSPAGTEYQLPIDRARKQAGGGGSSGSSDGSDTPLFGEGVEPTEPAASGAATKPRRGGDGGGGGGAPTTATGEQPDLGTSTPETVRAQAATPDGGGSELLAIGGGAAGVLLVGGLAGLAWRRRRRTA